MLDQRWQSTRHNNKQAETKCKYRLRFSFCTPDHVSVYIWTSQADILHSISSLRLLSQILMRSVVAPSWTRWRVSESGVIMTSELHKSLCISNSPQKHRWPSVRVYQPNIHIEEHYWCRRIQWKIIFNLLKLHPSYRCLTWLSLALACWAAWWRSSTCPPTPSPRLSSFSVQRILSEETGVLLWWMELSAVDGKCCVRLEKEGYKVTTSEEADKKNLKAKNVVFSAPPTGRRVFLQLRLVLHPQYYCTHPQETTNMQRMSPGL